jgi:hypothetical protein
MIKIASQAAQYMQVHGILLLDAYFFTVSMLTTLQSLNANKTYQLQVVTKAKCSCTAYRDPPPRKPGQRGRPSIMGEKVKLQNMFLSEQFTQVDIQFNDGTKQIQYYSVDLLWGTKIYQKVRFVLTIFDGCKSILVSTDLNLEPAKIVELYCLRFSIEFAFREMKQIVHGFDYRFWTKATPKLNRFRKKIAPEPLSEVTDENDRKRITQTLKAIEGYVLLCCIAMGLLQMISLLFSDQLNNTEGRWLRTYRNQFWSEATLNDYLQRCLIHLLALQPDLPITRIIQSKQSRQIVRKVRGRPQKPPISA